VPIKLIMVQELKKLANIAESERSLFVRYFEALSNHQYSLLENNGNAIPVINDEIAHISRIALSLKDYKKNAVNQLLENENTANVDKHVNMLLDRIREPEISDLENLKNTITETFDRINKHKIRNEDLIKQSLVMINEMEYQNHAEENASCLNEQYDNAEFKDQEGSSC